MPRPARASNESADCDDSVRALATPVAALTRHDPGLRAYQRFVEEPSLYALPVVDEQERPIGIINRFRFLEALSRPFGREVMNGRSVSTFMDRSPLVVEDATSVDDLSLALVAEGHSYLFDGFVITRRGRYLGVGTGLDVIRRLTERKQASLLHLAYHDILTGLPNRQLFSESLREVTACTDESAAVLFIDLDRFKAVNDTLGHGTGDLLLKAVAARLRESVRPQDTVARLSGDEFAVVLPGIGSSADAEGAAARLIASATAPFDVDGHEITISWSIGVAIYPDDASDAAGLVRAADDAVYSAKHVRNTWQRYSAEMRRFGSSLATVTSVRRAVEHEHLTVHYQPQVSLHDGRIRGVEALVRWRDPVTGFKSTEELVRVAEDTGLIVAIGEFVAKRAMETVLRWQREFSSSMMLSLNVSPVQFREGGLVAMLQRAMTDCGFPAERLELELTESTLMRSGSVTSSALARLRSIGVRFAVDDFGTGYSSLSRLRRLPVDTLKIDRSFVECIGVGEDDGAIARAILVMAHSLKLRVIAEGVETEEQVRFLVRHDCDAIQGYWFSRPLPSEALETFLRVPHSWEMQLRTLVPASRFDFDAATDPQR
jgi:diguanylate cyclase (GGDEF)-like protein